jgi:hypothetical protein
MFWNIMPCSPLKTNRRFRGQYPSQTPRGKSHTGLNLGTGVVTALTRHLLVLCVLFTFVAKFD